MDYPGYRVSARPIGSDHPDEMIFSLGLDNSPAFNAGIKQAIKDYVNSLPNVDYKAFNFYEITQTSF
jgi:hypothetical protein